VNLVIRVKRNSLLIPSNVIDYCGIKYLLLEHFTHPDWKTLRMMEADVEVSIQDQETSIEPITGRPQTTGLSTPRLVWASKKMISRERPDYVSRAAEQKFSLVLPEAVALNSLIDGERVKRVVPALGAFYVEIQ
jgi:hypothetical protein